MSSTYSIMKVKTFLPAVAVVILWVNTIEQNLTLRQLMVTRRSVVVQLPPNLVYIYKFACIVKGGKCFVGCFFTPTPNDN